MSGFRGRVTSQKRGILSSMATGKTAFNEAALLRWPQDQRYLVGVSGGRDSVALLHWLVASGFRKLIVCHLDHQLRGRSAAADARFVARIACGNRLPFELGRADVRALAADQKLSIETAARAARYSFFARVARRRRCQTVFLGHHADDAVETFLINLFRGAGSQGQRGMREVATLTVDKTELTIVRPLLGTPRAEIDSYIHAHRLRFRDDATNASLQPLRNRMRHRILPMLEKEFGRDIRNAVRRATAIAADEDAVLAEMLPPVSGRLVVSQVRALPVALQRRVIMRWLGHQEVADVGFAMIESVRASLDVENGPAKVNLTRGRHARRRAGELFIE
jgi:tRNA(Ile)-lysidine synthase